RYTGPRFPRQRSGVPMRRPMLLLCFVVALILGIGARPASAWAQDAPEKPPEAAPPAAEPPDQKDKDKAKKASEPAEEGEEEIENEPVTMKVGVRFKSLNKLDLAVGTFQSEVVVRVACDREPCKPHLEIVNGSGKAEKIEDSKLVKMYKYKADLNALIDTSAMPFDAHVLPLIIEDRKNLDAKFEIDDAHSSVDPDVKLPG